MSDTATGWRYDASNLAWEGDRASYLALDEDTRRLVDGIARFLEDELPTDPTLHEGCHPAETCNGTTTEEYAELLELRELETAVTNIFGVPQADEELDDLIRARLERERAEGEKDATIPSRANTAARKAMRLLLEGRLEVKRVDAETGIIHGRCRGDSGKVYDLGYDPRPGQRRWRCTCEELRGECSHLKALQLVTTIPIPTTTG